MCAHVVEGANLIVIATRDQYRLVEDIEGEPITRVRDLLSEPDEHPRPEENVLLLKFKDRRVVVIRTGQGTTLHENSL